MSRSQQLLKLIADDIQHDLQDYPALQEYLQQLHALLLKRDASGIESINAQIAGHTEAIRNRAARRSKILQAFQLSADAAGMQRLLAAYPASQRKKLQADWAQLASYTAECKHLNERNGQLLAMQHEIISQLVGKQSPLYAPQAY